MRSHCFSFTARVLAGVSLVGCTVAECPPDYQCRPLNDNGTGGKANTGGGTSKGGSAGSGGAIEDGSAGMGGMEAGPPPPGEWVQVTANLTGVKSQCGTVSGPWAKPDEDVLIVGVASVGLYATSDGGSSWQQLGQGKGSDAVNNGPTGITFDPDNPGTFWENGIHNVPGVFKTTDNGKTFKGVVVNQSDSLGIDFTDPDRKTLLSGVHEEHGHLWLSVDGGDHFTDIAANLRVDGNCTGTYVVDTQTFLVGCSGYGGGFAGILRSTDAGKSWTQVSTSGVYPGAPFRAKKDRALYWTNPPGAAGVNRSLDDGQTWKAVAGSGPITSLVELPDGRLAALSKDHLIVSADQGATWKDASPPLPQVDNPFANLAYSVKQKAFFITRWVCGSGDVPVPADSIQRYEFDYETR